MQMGSVFTVKWNAPCNISSSIPEFARCAAKNWNGKTSVESLGKGSETHFFQCKGCGHIHTVKKKYLLS